MEKTKTRLNRRLFLGNISKMTMLGILPSSFVRNSSLNVSDIKDDQANDFIAGPYLQFITPDQCTIMWMTKEDSFSWLEYGDGHFLHQKAYRIKDGLIAANNRINKITITGLKPDTTYNYRILSSAITDFQAGHVEFDKPIQSDTYTFKTPSINEDEVKWVVMNDIHDHPQTIPELLYRYGTNENKPDYDFVVFNGDTFSSVYSEDQIVDHLLTPCKNVFAKNNFFYLVRGNHGTRGSFARHLKDYFFYPEENYYTAFTRGPVRFVMMDSGEDKTDDNWEYSGLVSFDQYREKEAKWLEEEIEKEEFKKAPFRVVMMHIPPYHSGDWHGPMHCRKLFGPLFNKGKIDLFIGAHTHRYGVFDPDQSTHHYPIIIGGGPTKGRRTLIKVKADRKNLNLSMMRDDGKEVGKYSISSKI